MRKFVYFLALFIISIQFTFSQNNASYAVIEQEGMDVVYVGIPMDFSAGGGGAGYVDVKASPSVVVATADQVGKYITVQCIGKDKKGKEVVLGEKRYLVKSTPKPNLFLGDFKDGATLDSLPNILKVTLGDNIPFSPSKVMYTLESYYITVSGIKGALEGIGGTISEAHLKVLNEAARSGTFSISVKYSGTTSGRVTALFKGSSKLGLKANKEQFITDLKDVCTYLKDKNYSKASEKFVFPGMVSDQEMNEMLGRLIVNSEISDAGIELLSKNGTFGPLRQIFPERADKWINDMGFIGDHFPIQKIISDQDGNAQVVYVKKGNDTSIKKYETNDSRINTLEAQTETLDPSEAELMEGTPISVEYRVLHPLFAMKFGSAEVAGAWDGEHFHFFRLDDVGKLK
jgi:hypothetical protein